MAIELVILVGIPASGKSTFYRRHLRKHYLHVSLDHWRGKSNVRAKERTAIAEGLLQCSRSDTLRGVAADNTNTTAQTRQRYFQYAAEFAAAHCVTVELVAYWFDVPVELCLERNDGRPQPAAAPPGREYFVPPVAIHNFARLLQPPAQDEGFARVYRVRPRGATGFEVEAM